MRYFLSIILLCTVVLSSCDDTTDTIGMSLSKNATQLAVGVDADEFNVESHSVAANKLVSRSSYGYLGKVKDPETNSYVSCNFMTQQRSMGTGNQFPARELLESVKAESCELCIYFPAFYGDSLALMNIVAHELNKPYEEKDNDVLLSDFNPMEADKAITDEKEKWIRNGDGSIHQGLSYTIANHNVTESKRGSSTYTPYFSVSLNQEYKDKDGNTYNNYGTYLMQKYYDEATKADFDNQYNFLHKICPGFYLETTGGQGSMAKITVSQILVKFKAYENGNLTDMYSSFAGTEEVLQKTTFSQEWDANLLNSNECTYLKTPAAIFTELTIPVDEIVYGHENDTISSARIFVPRLHNTKGSSYHFPTPNDVILLPTSEVENFFSKKKVADGVTSHIATFNSQNNGYIYSNISQLVTKLYEENKEYINNVNETIKGKMEKQGWTIDKKDTPEYKAKKKEIRNALFPDMKKISVSLVPVEATYTTMSGNSVLTKVAYDMSLGSTRLAKGTGNYVDGKQVKSPITIGVVYSNFKN